MPSLEKTFIGKGKDKPVSNCSDWVINPELVEG